MDDVEEILAYDQEYNRYAAYDLGKVDFDDGWVSHSRFGGTEIEGGSRLKYAVGFSMPSRAKVSEIEFYGFDITLELGHNARQNLPELPEAISSKLS